MMTGVGIFIFPNLVLQDVQSGGASLIVWAGAGVVALLAGLCYSELSIALPVSHQVYHVTSHHVTSYTTSRFNIRYKLQFMRTPVSFMLVNFRLIGAYH